MAVPDDLNQALEAHRSGDWERAERVYRALLARNGDHVDANMLLGLLLTQCGQAEEGVALLHKANRLSPGNATILANLGLACQEAGRHGEAEQAYQEALNLAPDNVTVLNNLGSLYQDTGRRREAEECYRRVILLDPDFVQAYFNLGQLYRLSGDFLQAVSWYEQAVARHSGYLDAYFKLGKTYTLLERYTEARRVLDRAIEMAPQMAQGWFLRGELSYLQQRYDQAASDLHQAVALQSGFAEALFYLGNIARARNDPVSAMGFYRQALQSRPDYQDARANLVGVLNQLGHYSEALAVSEASLAETIGRESLDLAVNRATALYRSGRFREAMALFEQCLAVDPDYLPAKKGLIGVYCWSTPKRRRAVELADEVLAEIPDDVETHWNLSQILLWLGELDRGWDEYEWGLRPGGGRAGVTLPLPVWNGEDLRGRRLIVTAEQGIGDEVLFASCVPDLLAECRGEVILYCDPRLVSLYERSFPGAGVIGGSKETAAQRLAGVKADCYLSIGSLPRFFRRRAADFPASNVYLVPDPMRVACWRERLQGLGEGLKVGIAWRSGIRDPIRDRGYTELDQWKVLFDIPGIEIVNLQYGECRHEIEAVEQRYSVRIHRLPEIDLFNDLDDLTALLRALDLVIVAGISTYVFSGAVGQRTFLTGAVPYLCCGFDYMPWLPAVTPLGTHAQTLLQSFERIPQVIEEAKKARDRCPPAARGSAARNAE